MPTAVFERKRVSSRKHVTDPRQLSRGVFRTSRMEASVISAMARERTSRKGGLSRGPPRMPPSSQREHSLQSWQARTEVLETENRLLWDVVLDLQNHLPPGVAQASLRSVLAREEALEATKNARLGMRSLREQHSNIPSTPGSPPPPPPPPESPQSERNDVVEGTTDVAVGKPPVVLSGSVDTNNKRPLLIDEHGEVSRSFKSRRFSKGDSPSSIEQDSTSEGGNSVDRNVRFCIPTRFIDGSPIAVSLPNTLSRDQIFRLQQYTL